MEKKRSGEGGFTLVELLIVIVILGILAAIVVLAIGGLSGTAQSATCNSGAKTIESAEDAYFAQNNTYANQNAGSKQLWIAQGNAANLMKADTSADFNTTGTANGYSIAAVATGKCANLATITYP
jgi:general secretion pathway protein G